MTGPGDEPTVVRIDAPRVEGTIALEDIARRLQAAAQEAAAEHDAAPGVPRRLALAAVREPGHRQRLDRLSLLAGQLADELRALPAEALHLPAGARALPADALRDPQPGGAP
jgi:hypothetical protein